MGYKTNVRNVIARIPNENVKTHVRLHYDCNIQEFPMCVNTHSQIGKTGKREDFV